MHWIAAGIAGLLVLAALIVSLRRLASEPASRRVLITVLRGLSLLLLLAMLWNPVTTTGNTVRVPGEPRVLIDTSASMGLPVDGQGPSRLYFARDSLGEVLRRIAGTENPAAPELYSFSSTVRHLRDLTAVAADGDRTDLAAAVGFIAAEAPGAPVLIATDGADTESARVEETGQTARAAGLKLSFLAVGKPRPVRDVAVTAIQAPRQVREGASFELQATIRSQGIGDRRLPLDVLRDGRTVTTRQVPAGKPRTVSVSLKAGAPGRYRYELRVPAVEGEITGANNSRAALVNVLPDRTRVLLIAGAPNPEYAAIKRLLLADRNLNITCLVRKTAADWWRDDSTPRKASLASSLSPRPDAVILQDVPGAAVASIADRIAQLVRAGAGVAVLGGPQISASPISGPLGTVLPAHLQGSYLDEVFDVTPGAGLDALGLEAGSLSGLPALRGRNALGSPRRGASVSLSAGGSPLLVTGPAGQGRAAVLATNSTHRWVLSAGSSNPGQKAFAHLWGSLLDWLTEVRDDRPVVAEFDRDAYPLGESARLLVQVSDSAGLPVDGAEVTARTELAGERGRFTCPADSQVPGRYQAFIPGPVPGEMTASVTASLSGRDLGIDSARTRFVPSERELAVSQPNRALLEALAKQTGGIVASPGQQEALVKALRSPGQEVSRETRRNPLREAWALWILVGLLGLDWALRRAWGV
ncbi:MAG: hypothetical protein QM473_12540 [Acidobacteriota bacterium]|nr:hypothetical protein [Acidobacteriota bacterium]